MSQRFLLPAVVASLAVVAAACSSVTGGSATPQSSASAVSSPAAAAAAGTGSVPTVLVLDASGSMTTNDAPGARIDAAKRAATTLVDALPDTAQLGLVNYGIGTGSADAEKTAGCQDVATLTKLGPIERAKAKQEIEGLRPSGYTPISLALQKSAALLPADGKQAIVLVSDGEDTCGTPPCDVAKQLRTQRPGLAISTVGFKTEGAASEQLRCVATATGGLFVSAANANQLVARLLATQDVGKAKTSLTSTGFDGVELGKLALDIKKLHADFPDVATQGQVQVLWHDCDFGFSDGVLNSIAPADGGRTVDGLTAGSPASKATGLYGAPVQATDNKDGTTTAIYTAAESAGTAYRMLLNGHADTGTIRTIILCRCLPKKPSPSTTRTPRPPAPTRVVATAKSFGPVQLGMTLAQARTAAGPTAAAGFSNSHCQTVEYMVDGGEAKATIHDTEAAVVQITTPPGTKTDRGVGDSSTILQVTAAYTADHAVRQINTENGMALYVTTGDPDRVGRGNPGGLIGFKVRGNTVGPPVVGEIPDAEVCSG